MRGGGAVHGTAGGGGGLCARTHTQHSPYPETGCDDASQGHSVSTLFESDMEQANFERKHTPAHTCKHKNMLAHVRVAVSTPLGHPNRTELGV
jgi:hypothetical protein